MICLCILSLNFFNDIPTVLSEIKRVLMPGGMLIGCVPVPERNGLKSTIRGTLYSEVELERMCQRIGLRFIKLPYENGALLYFKVFI